MFFIGATIMFISHRPGPDPDVPQVAQAQAMHVSFYFHFSSLSAIRWSDGMLVNFFVVLRKHLAQRNPISASVYSAGYSSCHL
jgi:hypothetical protein